MRPAVNRKIIGSNPIMIDLKIIYIEYMIFKNILNFR